VIDELLQDGRARVLLGLSQAYASAHFDPAAARAAAEQVRAHPDAGAFPLLMALRREAPDAYAQLEPELRAGVLADALRELPELNDFGWMEPGGGYDGPAAQALLELGEPARDALLPLLADRRPAPLAGSEAATLSHLYGYRRADFAFRYLCELDGREPRFAADPSARDAAIEELN
jgi:hypothetical protein